MFASKTAIFNFHIKSPPLWSLRLRGAFPQSIARSWLIWMQHFGSVKLGWTTNGLSMFNIATFMGLYSMISPDRKSRISRQNLGASKQVIHHTPKQRGTWLLDTCIGIQQAKGISHLGKSERNDCSVVSLNIARKKNQYSARGGGGHRPILPGGIPSWNFCTWSCPQWSIPSGNPWQWGSLRW